MARVAPFISKKDLVNVFQVLLSKGYEACGFLRENKGTPKLQLYLDKYGNVIKNRGVCQTDHYEKYIWHTHPRGLIAYPSAEDFVNMLQWHAGNEKNNFPVCSVIFTDWGIWEIASKKKFTLDQKWREFLLEVVTREADGLFHVTEKGLKLGKNGLNYVHDYIKNVMYNINKEPAFDIRLSFLPWGKIKGNSYYLRYY